MTPEMSEPQENSDAKAARLHNARAIEELVVANEESNRTMLSLVEGVHQETAARDRKVDALDRNLKQMRWITRLFGFAIVVLMAVGVFNAINLNKQRRNQQQIKDIAASTESTNRTLLECLNATGECGKVNAENQGRILDSVKRYELTVVYCGRTNPQPVDPKGDKFLACIARLYPGGPTLDRKNQ